MQNRQGVQVPDLEFTITGMSCISCEQRITRKLMQLPGVGAVQVSHATGKARVAYNPELTNRQQVVDAITGLGYAVADKKRTGMNILQLVGMGVILAALWLLLERMGIFTRIPVIEQSMGFGLLFLVGVMTSLHCIAMCGSINLSQSVRGNQVDKEKFFSKIKPGLLYNLGRVISYTVIGGIVGMLGSVISISGIARVIIVIATGLVMMLMGINMLGLFPWLRKITPRLPAGLTRRITRLKTGKGPLLVGLINGFMPCGPLQSMQLYALGTGSFLAGAGSMLVFSLGTVPLMLGFGVLGSLLSGRSASKMLKISALLVFLLGCSMVFRGFALSGIGAGPQITMEDQAENVALLRDNFQTVESDVFSSSYETIIVQKGIPVRWTINVKQEDLNGCNNPITVPGFGIEKKLAAGKNYVEFTPAQSGNITMTCWMGMITGTIKVVDSLAAE